MEAWLEVAQGLLEIIEENVKSSNSEAAAKSCWLVERVWKLLMSTMDLLHIMDPDDFMKLKHELAINTSSQLGVDTSVEHIGGGKCCAKDFLWLILHVLLVWCFLHDFRA
jgi:tryptophan 2,3-dioxygenase